MIDLGGQVQSPQRDAEQEPHPGHDPVAIADARVRLGQVQLKLADVLARSAIMRSLQKCREALAAVNVASLRVRPQLAHIFDHTLTQRGDSLCAIGETRI
jgi:hypothetical protein